MHPQARSDEVRAMEHQLESTAHYLSAYHHAPEFLEKVASLVQITEDGTICHPQLPGGSWAFDPENIAFRNQPSSGTLLSSLANQEKSAQ